MKLFSDPRCLNYHSPGHPERPQRVQATVERLKASHPEWDWPPVEPVSIDDILPAHGQFHLQRLLEPKDFDGDTAYHEGIFEIARLASGASVGAMRSALDGVAAISLMRPPGHHAESERAMGFCYLNHVAITALAALNSGIERVAIWDFDAHHGNGTEAIVSGMDRIRYVSVHQHPCYPGTGIVSRDNAFNFPTPPNTEAGEHMETLSNSWETALNFDPELVLVSAGFDAYLQDPLTQMRLGIDDFKTLGQWLGQSSRPVAATLEGGYSEDLPLLVDAFLEGWSGS